LQTGRKKQDEIESKIDGLYKQNLELISQNKTLLAEINNKTEYTKTLEQLFMFILEFFTKKNEGGSTVPSFSTNPKASSDCLNTIIEKSKDLFTKDRDVSNSFANINKPNYPMLMPEESVKFSSIHASPTIFPKQDLDSCPQFNFDLFDNNEMRISRRNSNISGTPKLLIEDYMNITNSPATSYGEIKEKTTNEGDEKDTKSSKDKGHQFFN
jgi:hypothetical protein